MIEPATARTEDWTFLALAINFLLAFAVRPHSVSMRTRRMRLWGPRLLILFSEILTASRYWQQKIGLIRAVCLLH